MTAILFRGWWVYPIKPAQNGCYFAHKILKCILVNRMFDMLIWMPPKLDNKFSGDGLVPSRQPTMTWMKDDPIAGDRYASVGLKEFIIICKIIFCCNYECPIKLYLLFLHYSTFLFFFHDTCNDSSANIRIFLRSPSLRCRVNHILASDIWNKNKWRIPDSKVHMANMGPTWVLSAPDGPHVGPMNLAIRDESGWVEGGLCFLFV